MSAEGTNVRIFFMDIKEMINKTAFLMSFKSLNKQFIHVVIFDFIYYTIFSFVSLFWVYRILPTFLQIIKAADFLDGSEFVSLDEFVGSIETVSLQLTEVKIYTIVCILILFLNYSFFKYLIWQKIQNKNKLTDKVNKVLKNIAKNLALFALLNIIIFIFFIAVLVISYYIFSLETFNILFFFVVPVILIYTINLLHPLFVVSGSLKQMLIDFFTIGIKNIHKFIIPYTIMMIGVVVVMQIVPFLLFLPQTVYFVWYVLAFASYLSWTKYYLYALILKIKKSQQNLLSQILKVDKKGKKAQLTLFIILGLFIVMSVGLFLYFTSEIYKYKALPEEFVPVAKYTEQCIEDVALQAIFLAGINGGTPYPVYDETDEKEAYLEAGFPVPYWYLAGEERSVAIQQLEADIEKYIQKNLNTCLDFKSFAEFNITMPNEENIIIKTDVGQNRVEFEAEIPVQITDGTTMAVLPTLKTGIDNSIGNKLFLAHQIMQLENEEGFLEFYTNEIIAASDWLPYEGLDFTCKPKRWSIAEMKLYIQQAIAVNLKFLMFEGTSYEKTGDPYYDNIYKVNLGATGVSDLSVRTTYNPLWNMELDVQPNTNGIVTDIKLVGKTIAIPCVKVYHHKYSAYFPVLFEITDKDNADYPFFFATPVIMRRNEPDRYGEMQPWQSEVDIVRSQQYCSNTTKTTLYTLNKDGTITTQEAEENNWPYTLDIIAMDSQYGFDGILKDVHIKYKCMQFECDIGNTSYGSGGIITVYPLLHSSFPTCLNGQIIAEKDGYHPAKAFQSVTEDTDSATINLEMYRLKKLGVDVNVVQNHNNVISERGIEDDELAVLTLKNEGLGFEKIIVTPIDSEDATGFDEFELLVADDVTYNVDIKLIEKDRYTGAFEYNWTPEANAITSATKAVFYVIKKDLLVETDENYRKAIQYALDESANYQPILS